MNGRVTRSNDTVLPIVAANATSSTTTRPCRRSARGSARGDANISCGICTPDHTLFPARREGSALTVHRHRPAIVEIHFAHRAAIATLRGARDQQTQCALTAVGDQRTAAPGRDLAERRAVDPDLDRV